MQFEQLQDIIAKQLNLDKENITLTTSLTDDLKADSLDIVEIIMTIEDTFGIEIEDEAAEKFKVLKDVVDYVNSKL